jgi:hypothetical protein
MVGAIARQPVLVGFREGGERDSASGRSDGHTALQRGDRASLWPSCCPSIARDTLYLTRFSGMWLQRSSLHISHSRCYLLLPFVLYLRRWSSRINCLCALRWGAGVVAFPLPRRPRRSSRGGEGAQRARDRVQDSTPRRWDATRPAGVCRTATCGCARLTHLSKNGRMAALYELQAVPKRQGSFRSILCRPFGGRVRSASRSRRAQSDGHARTARWPVRGTFQAKSDVFHGQDMPQTPALR